ncbi:MULTISPECIES: hypothetical protein [unclassified Haladaptatus]|uniref:hypothetical protein n=1 Tax=unclassified Haladaptatus TaxID=2622732 RepID=UPI0023E8D801|nr:MULTISPECIES: hypothetical protein [unclassified Haladaptatus]
MAGIHISLSGPVALAVALVGAFLIYRDGRGRNMDTADMWAVGFFIGFFIPPIIGGLLVLAFYLRKRKPKRTVPYGVPAQ